MSKYSNVAHYQDFSELEKIIENSGNEYDMEKIRSAYEFAEKSHGDQRRVSGIPYILHPTSVACIVAELGMDEDSVCAALLHDVVEDADITIEEIEEIDGVIHFKYRGGAVGTHVEDVEIPTSVIAIYNILGQKQPTTDMQALSAGTYIVVTTTGTRKIIR